MSKSERINDRVMEFHIAKSEASGGKCERCGKQLNKGIPQLAHIIPQKKWALARYGDDVVHHYNNMKITCSQKCNSSYSLGNNTYKCDQQARRLGWVPAGWCK